VEAAAPAGLKSARRVLQQGVPTFAEQIKERFFSGTGPSDVYALLDSIDERIRSLNRRVLDNNKACATMDPIEITVNGWPTETFISHIQCYERMSDDLFILFGWRNETFYLMEVGQVTRAFAKVHLNARGEVDDVHLHYSVGAQYATNESGSRGLVAVRAKPIEDKFEASIAGIGMGFCGVQLVREGAVLKTIGSMDTPGGACGNVTSSCFDDALAEIALSSCENITRMPPALGRLESTNYILPTQSMERWHASAYPGAGANNVNLDTSVLFGPSEVPAVLTNERNFGE
jgi:hypothetical protein